VEAAASPSRHPVVGKFADSVPAEKVAKKWKKCLKKL